ncbi:L,D-transpeptidase family protein [Szabonella alba]|uniref:L,D-transpeptidase family protein n=1 Tax=Szabonella alba TaxID=2804194 RepID=A0A8K0VC68_9RHOB|nr:L,D-transpeptidase family protein [Szabonella alba]MBL4917195.1 L,D-transpeptidase family protein [Szabonella alba]
MGLLISTGLAAGIGTAPQAVAQSGVVTAQPARAGTAFTQALAEAALADDAVAGFFRDRNYAPFWTAPEGSARRMALLAALDGAGAHGLPMARHDPMTLIRAAQDLRTEGDRARLEVAMTLAMLDYARDVQTGALVPGKVIPSIVREVPLRDRRANLDAFAVADPVTFLKSLPPQSQSYVQLMKAKFELEARIARGGWGPQVGARSLRADETGPAVIALRDRLQAMGYLGRSAAASYDAVLQRAVQAFQTDHGLEATGIAGPETLTQINIDPESRLESVIVALERERWMNIERGKRHIWVNLTDFTAKIIDNGKVTFATRAVIGAPDRDKPTPEFSHRMTYMEVNPDWTVPGGIIRRDYLPKLQANPNALGHLQVIDRRGRVVPRSQINFAGYSAGNFPFNLRQPPGRSNALGLVKFMFPNPYAIYLHDSPEKHLFSRESRAFSSGCVRLNDPFDFAYELLSRQEADPKTVFHRVLDSGRQERISLKEPVPIHLAYFTAFAGPKGRMQYRRDIYGRDAAIFAALKKAGVSPEADRS